MQNHSCNGTNLASNLPILVEVVVTSMASWPPPITTWATQNISAFANVEKDLLAVKLTVAWEKLQWISETYMVHVGWDGSGVNGSFCLEGFDVFKVCGIKHLHNEGSRMWVRLTQHHSWQFTS